MTLAEEQFLNTPFLAISKEILDENINLLTKHLSSVKLFYAVKANSSLAVLNYFLNRSISFDVASAGEINLLTSIGAKTSDLFLSTPIKTQETISALFEHEIPYATVDTVHEVERIVHYWREKKTIRYLPSLFIRLALTSSGAQIDLNKKFGCKLDEGVVVAERASSLGFKVSGISFHVGSNCINPSSYKTGINAALQLASLIISKTGIKPSIINIGGGFCDKRHALKLGICLDEYFSYIQKSLIPALDKGFSIYAEPGRILVSNAGTLVSSIIGISIRNGVRWAYLNDGIYGCYSIKLYEKQPLSFIRIKRNSGTNDNLKSNLVSWTLAGPTCDSLDVVAEDAILPENLKVGDLIISPDMGAYSIATACNFNGFKPPPCYLIENNYLSNDINLFSHPRHENFTT
jgi:ornithine decarboxylase